MSSLEDLFGKIALTTVTTVSRIALSHATNAAIRNVTSYVTTQLPKNKEDTKEICTLQRQLDLKIKNLKPTIDIIARSVANGNRELDSALEMCNDLKKDIEEFGNIVKDIKEVEKVKLKLKRILNNVDDAIPSIHLALRSIENKEGRNQILISKLINASNIICGQKKQWTIKLYSLFKSNQKEIINWKEEFNKAELKLIKNNGFNYDLLITEDINDELYHEEEEIQEIKLNISNLNKMYYTQSGELLNIDDLKSPVLVLKLLKNQTTKNDDRLKIEESKPDIIKEELNEIDWFAIGLYLNEKDDDLILLENLIKLTLLETTEEISHLDASDELINLYMK